MPLRKTTRHIVIHCAATKPQMDIGATEIRRWHKDKGWADIGYHWVIRRDGTLERGRPESDVGAHEPKRNADSVAICLVGGINDAGKPENNFTSAQFVTLYNLLKDILKRYPNAPVSGHNYWQPGRACPSFNWRLWATKNQFKTVGD